MNTQKQKSKSRQLKDHLLKQMREQHIAVGGRLPSETTLMQQFSLSRSTVRQVLLELSAQGLIQPQQGRGTFRVGDLPVTSGGTGDFRDQSATGAGSGQFRPDEGRRSLDPNAAPALSQPDRRQPRRATGLVGVWFNWPTGPLFGPIAEGIHGELRKWGYHAVFEAGGLEPGAEYRGIERLVRKGLDGFIVSPATNLDDEHRPLIELIGQNVPLVLVDRKLPGYETHLVATQGELGAEELVAHLIRLGHRRIGYIGISGLSTLEERLQGYRRMMQEHRLLVDEAWVRNEPEVAADCGLAAAADLLSLPPERRPTAMLGATDVIAETIAIAARRLKIEIPGGLSIAGFDDVNIDPARPAWLTTYAQPKQRIGRQAARLLMKQIQQPTRSSVIILLEGKLVERDSTAPPAESPSDG